MSNLIERQKTLESLLEKRLNHLQQIEISRQQLSTEIISIQGKLNLLKELMLEENNTNKNDAEIEEKE